MNTALEHIESFEGEGVKVTEGGVFHRMYNAISSSHAVQGVLAGVMLLAGERFAAPAIVAQQNPTETETRVPEKSESQILSEAYSHPREIAEERLATYLVQGGSVLPFITILSQRDISLEVRGMLMRHLSLAAGRSPGLRRQLIDQFLKGSREADIAACILANADPPAIAEVSAAFDGTAPQAGERTNAQSGHFSAGAALAFKYMLNRGGEQYSTNIMQILGESFRRARRPDEDALYHESRKFRAAELLFYRPEGFLQLTKAGSQNLESAGIVVKAVAREFRYVPEGELLTVRNLKSGYAQWSTLLIGLKSAHPPLSPEIEPLLHRLQKEKEMAEERAKFFPKTKN